MLIFQLAEDMREINYGQFPLFEPLFSASWHRCSTLGMLRGATEALRGASEVLKRDFKRLPEVDACI